MVFQNSALEPDLGNSLSESELSRLTNSLFQLIPRVASISSELAAELEFWANELDKTAIRSKYRPQFKRRRRQKAKARQYGKRYRRRNRAKIKRYMKKYYKRRKPHLKRRSKKRSYKRVGY